MTTVLSICIAMEPAELMSVEILILSPEMHSYDSHSGSQNALCKHTNTQTHKQAVSSAIGLPLGSVCDETR